MLSRAEYLSTVRVRRIGQRPAITGRSDCVSCHTFAVVGTGRRRALTPPATPHDNAARRRSFGSTTLRPAPPQAPWPAPPAKYCAVRLPLSHRQQRAATHSPQHAHPFPPPETTTRDSRAHREPECVEPGALDRNLTRCRSCPRAAIRFSEYTSLCKRRCPDRRAHRRRRTRHQRYGSPPRQSRSTHNRFRVTPPISARALNRTPRDPALYFARTPRRSASLCEDQPGPLAPCHLAPAPLAPVSTAL